MVSLGNQEQALIDGLTACLATAVRKSDNYDLSDLNQTKTQKLVYLAAKEFDCSLTYSWFLAGSYAAGASDGYSQVETAFDTLPSPPSPEGPSPDTEPSEKTTDEELPEISREFEMEREADERLGDPDEEPTEAADTDSTVDPDTPTEAEWLDAVDSLVIPDDFPLTPEDVVNFYTKLLRQYPLHPTDRFLQQFYHYHAPEKYTALYEHCLNLRSVLRETAESIEQSLNNAPGTVDFSRHREDFGLSLSDFHLELYRIDELSDMAERVVAATEPIEAALIELAAMDESGISEQHLEVVEELREYFYNTVWCYPALKVSVETATGPSAGEIVEEHTSRLEDCEMRLRNQQAAMWERLAAVGLLPDAATYTAEADEETTQLIGELMTSDGNTSPRDGE